MTRKLLALCGVMMFLLSVTLSMTLVAQQRFDPTPYPISPNTILITATPTRDPDVCDRPLPIQIGQVIYIKPGVNIRNLPTESGGIVWNTVYDNTDEDGELNERIVNVAARVTEGPVCNGGINWWRVVGLDTPGWVAEGRPDLQGYFLIVPGVGIEGCATIYTITAGTTVDLLLNVKVRAEANINSLVLTVAPAGTPVEILGGGECVNGLKWWNVRVNVVNVNYTGWMTESDGSDYWLVPRDLPSTENGTLCGAPLGLAIGQEGYVNTRGVGEAIALRSAPDLDGPLLFSLVDNVPLVIEGGPVCADNLNWWRVRILASSPVIGWMAEGSRGVGYWISVIRGDEFRYDQSLPDATSTSTAPLPNQPPANATP